MIRPLGAEVANACYAPGPGGEGLAVELVAAALPRLPPAALLVIWGHLEYPQLVVARWSCQRLHAHLSSLPLERVGTPMVLSALLFNRSQQLPGAEAAIASFSSCRTCCLALYLLLLGFAVPAVLISRPAMSGVVDSTKLIAMYAMLVICGAVAVFTPLGTPAHGWWGISERDLRYLRLQATEEYYIPSQWRMVRCIWVAYSAASILCPLLCIDHAVLISVGLLAPVLAVVPSIVAIRREFPSGSMRQSLIFQTIWLSCLLLSLLSAAAARWSVARGWASRIGFVTGGLWCSVTAVMAPRVVRQLQEMSTSTWPTAAAVPGNIGGGGGGRGAFAVRRHACLSSALLGTRLAVFWVAILLPFELLRLPVPALLLSVPATVASFIAVMALLRLSIASCRVMMRSCQLLPRSFVGQGSQVVP